MPQVIPINLLSHKQGQVQTTSLLIKIGPLPSGAYIGLTDLNRKELYDDLTASGEMPYYAASGAEFSVFEATNDLSVDNAEFRSLITYVPESGITKDMVERGELDTVEYVVYEHDYLGGAAGEHRVVASGTLGSVQMEQGIVVIPELRSWTQLLKQNGLISRTSINCRAIHGSMPGERREFCGYDLDANGEWVAFTVTAQGTETEREFVASGLLQATDYFQYGAVKFDTGDNAGRQRELESFTSGGIIAMHYLFPHPVKVGDTGQIRRGCSLMWEGHNSCETYNNRPNFKGEPKMVIGNSRINSIPGVNATTSTGGTGE